MQQLMFIFTRYFMLLVCFWVCLWELHLTAAISGLKAKWFTLSLRSQTSGNGWLSPRKLCLSWRQSESRGSATMTRSCCWPSPRLKMYRWEYKDSKPRWYWSKRKKQHVSRYWKKSLFSIFGCICFRGKRSASTRRPLSWSRRFATCRISCCPSANRGSTRRRRSNASTEWVRNRCRKRGRCRIEAFLCVWYSDFVLLQALEEALNLHSPSSSQQPPGQGNFADAANNLKKQELLTQIAVLKEQVRHAANHKHTHSVLLRLHMRFLNCVSLLFCASGKDLWRRLQKRKEWQGANEWGKRGFEATSWETPGSDY